MANDDWITPQGVISALGPFDLDPCAHPEMPWPTAQEMIAPPADGLSREWYGLVWLNPPYSRGQPALWLEKLVNHPRGGVALLNLSGNAVWFHRWVWMAATAVLIPQGRIEFCQADGTPGGNPRYENLFAAFGREGAARLLASGIGGRFLLL